jgi:TolA-binding protein
MKKKLNKSSKTGAHEVPNLHDFKIMDMYFMESDNKTIFRNHESYLSAKSDLEEAMSDPDLKNLDQEVKKMVADHDHVNDPEEKDIRRFIEDSIKTSDGETGKNNKVRSVYRSAYFKWISLSAAAVLGIFFLLKTLFISADPERLYKQYYEPYKVSSVTTRAGESKTDESFAMAIGYFKAGDYQAADKEFSGILLGDSTKINALFFKGITELAVGNFSRAADMLKKYCLKSGDYIVEARWYLGLSYLGMGDTEKASGCFKTLSSSPGFYNSRASALLRRLK